MRLTPLPEERWDDDVDAALAGMLPRRRRNPQGAGNALATLVRHPDLVRAFMPFNVHLLFRSTLSDRIREITILRVAELNASPYEVEHHTGMALAAGLTLEEIDDARRGTAADPLEQHILDAVGELHRDHGIGDETWAALGVDLDERQLMDLVFTVGAYSTLSMAFNTFGIEPDRELQPEYER
ncbi:carboxymuconolactone decarboxylase family protein [Gordonia sp. LSe1-13]|uniref:Carboxymuconolactone decarboxylase family protein n=1 Tax=Gordonia sesuvii TaxID=3116777 RepID=A0ABU7M8T9_9ACTN|nr:carboxymuconolactone decarboxylase family protein [Gordonia sp. LSe1-13]